MSAGEVRIDTKALDKLIATLGERPPVARVGILGSTNTRSSSEKTNAEIGLIHEFGGAKVPMRSFLRMPLTDYLDKYLKKAGAFDAEVLSKVVREGTLVPWLKTVALTAERVVADAFATSGFGKWKASDMRYKQNKQTLVETQQLRNSITSEVKE